MSRENLLVALQPERTEHAQEHPLHLRFAVTNTSRLPVTLLKWHTPLEGSLSDMFVVEHAGRPVPYTGILVKRVQPQAADFTVLEPGATLTSVIDLEPCYQMDRTGDYSVRFRAPLWATGTVARRGRDMAKAMEKAKEFAEEVASEPVTMRLTEERPRPKMKVEPNFSGCSAAQIKQLGEALGEAEHIASNAFFVMDATPESQRAIAPRFAHWFGAFAAARYDTVRSHFLQLHETLANKKVGFHNDPNSPHYAYVNPGNPYEIYLGKAFWTAPMTGTDSKAGTILHETSHFTVVAANTDHVYGHAGCENLAQTAPDKAIHNADSHEYFCENTPPLAMVAGPSKLLVVRAAPSGPDKSTKDTAFADIPDMSATVTTPAQSSVEITLSAEASTAGNKRMFVRALVDGVPAQPTDVVFVLEPFTGTRSFTFARTGLTAGVHDIRLQWSVDAGGTAYIGDRTLTILASPPAVAGSAIAVQAAPSGPDKTTTKNSFADIPDLMTTVKTGATTNIEIMVSAEVNTTPGRRMFVRALVDGAPASPSDVIFVAENFTGTRSFTFTKEDLAPGTHKIQIQWLVDSGGIAYIGDRTLCVLASPKVLADTALVLRTAPSGPDKTTTLNSFVDIPDLAGTVTTGKDINLEIKLSAEIDATPGKRVFVRTLVDNVPARPSDVVIVAEQFTGTRSFVFTVPNVKAGTHTVRCQWAIDQGGQGCIGDRSMTLAAAPFAG